VTPAIVVEFGYTSGTVFTPNGSSTDAMKFICIGS
jgi:hypothetical protein